MSCWRSWQNKIPLDRGAAWETSSRREQIQDTRNQRNSPIPTASAASRLGKAHFPQNEAMGRGDGADRSTISNGDHLLHLRRPPPSQPHVDAQPDQRPHHLMAERLGPDSEDHPLVLCPPARFEDVAHRRRPWSPATEAGEVVLPDEGGSSDVHCPQVERLSK